MDPEVASDSGLGGTTPVGHTKLANEAGNDSVDSAKIDVEPKRYWPQLSPPLSHQSPSPPDGSSSSSSVGHRSPESGPSVQPERPSSDDAFDDLPKRQRARKSTGAIDKSKIATAGGRRKQTVKRRLEVKRHQGVDESSDNEDGGANDDDPPVDTGRHSEQQQRPQSEGPNGVPQRESSARASDYRGPFGQGIGKGSMRRIQAAYRARRQERVALLARRSRDYEERSDIAIAPFVRCFKYLFKQLFPDKQLRFQPIALLAAKDACEHYLIQMFEKSNLFAIHAKRVTLMPRDIALYKRVIEEKKFMSLQNG